MALPSGRFVGRVGIVLGSVLCAATAFALDTQLVESGFTNPLFMTAPNGDARLFVVERAGRIRVGSGGVWSTFLDIRSQVKADGERGLLGLAFDPNFSSNGNFYVDYIDKNLNTRIDRYTISPSSPNALQAVVTPLLTVAQPAGRNNHKAGWIGFRPGEPDNLYIATGDGGSGNDPDGNGQSTSTRLGKILRIDVRSDAFPNDPDRNYAIPAGNPFPNGSTPEIWDYGLRNPFRNSFDRLKGNLIIADVGQGELEELDFESASSLGGNNYGWRLREGTIPTPGVGGSLPGAIDPVFEYAHDGRSKAVTGGYVYRGSLLKEIEGEYFFSDFETGQVWSLDTDPATGALLPGTLRDRTDELKRLNAFGNVASFGEDGSGNLYILDFFSGNLLRIVPEPSTYIMILLALVPLAWRTMRRAS